MRAIDVHCHLNTEKGIAPFTPEEIESYKKYYKNPRTIKTEDEMAQDFVKADVKGLLIAWDCGANRGTPPVTNDYVAGVVKRHPEVYLGAWAMIDPWKGKLAIQELERCVKELGMIGLKFQQIAQGFFLNDRRFYPLYEKCVELKVPVLIHTGTSGLGAGMPGGGGHHLKYTKPIPHLDDMAADFPELTIIGAHPAWPWQEEMIAVLLHKGNVYQDLSGWAPKYFPESLKKEINGRLQDKCMFGTDYPEIPFQRWFDEFEKDKYKPEVIEKVLLKNAQRILKIGI